MYQTAKSGEVFTIIDGELKKFNTLDEYKKYTEREKRIKSTFFTFEDGTTKYRYNIRSHKSIMGAIRRVQDLARQVELVQEYYTIKQEVLG